MPQWKCVCIYRSGVFQLREKGDLLWCQSGFKMSCGQEERRVGNQQVGPFLHVTLVLLKVSDPVKLLETSLIVTDAI